MKLILCLICLTWFFTAFNKQIKKHASIFYIITVLISALTIFVPHDMLPAPVVMFINKILVRGVFQGAIFIIVMYVAVLPSKSQLRIKLSKVRGEMAIIAALFTLIHNISYGKRYFMLLFTDISALKPYEAAAAVLSICMIILLVPLTVTSFYTVRKKMSGKNWKKLQRLSYIFYALLYLHIVLIFSRGLFTKKLTYLVDIYIYTLIFGIYAALRVIKYIKKKANARVLKGEADIKNFNAPAYIKNKTILSTAVFSALMLGVCIYSTYIYGSAGINSDVRTKNEKTAEDSDAGKAKAQNKVSENTGSDQKDMPDQEDIQSTAKGFKDGEYEGSAIGYNGKLIVSVVVEGGAIKDIKIVKHVDDEEYFYDARDKVIQSILEKQSTEVDSVSGATTSADAIIKAVKRALGEIK